MTLTEVGTPGVPTVSEFDGAELGLEPAPLAAVTEKVYVVPVASPLNRHVVVDPLAVVHVLAPGLDVTV